MAHRLFRGFRGSGHHDARVQGVKSLARIMGVLAILSLLAVASLNAQDKPQSTDAPKKVAPSTGGPAPTPAPIDSNAEPAPQPVPPRINPAAEPVTINTVVLGNLAPRRFQFTIDPKTPLKDLLPIPPSTKTLSSSVTVKDLNQVPEVQFQMPLAKMPTEEAQKQTAHTMAKINHLNDKKTDGFLEALRRERLDLAGMPFAMGEACRTKGDRSKQFAIEVGMVRSALQQDGAGEKIDVFGSVDFAPSAPQGGSLLPPPAVAPAPAALPVPPAAPMGGSTPNPVAEPASPPAVVASPKPAPQPAPSTNRGELTTVTGQPDLGAVIVNNNGNTTVTLLKASDRNTAEKFWGLYQSACAKEDTKFSHADHCQQEIVTFTRIAALMQVLAPEAPGIRLGLVKFLSGISHAEATRALAKLAIFSTEDVVRQRAVDALKVRRERDYTDTLLAGLRYPWPDVARRAADALVKLERTDLVPQLVDLLDEPDPRAPVARDENSKRLQEVRELVRVNHHRSCLLCHAPANTGTVAADTLTAAVPTPGDPLPSPSQGYQNSLPDILVRIDVTYLRQDFSMFQAVADANPWPEMQRFDFLVRTRTLTDKEADAYREKLTPKEPGVLSPYHRAALAALRELTGRDTAPTSEAWRQLLKLPAKAPVAAASLRTASAR